MQFKYIIVLDEMTNKEYAIIFPVQLIHREVARIHRAGVTVLKSAGFVTFSDELVTFGYSESLGMVARDIDAEIIKKDFGGLRC